MKRTFDLLLAIAILSVLSPLIAIVALVIFLQDWSSPLFISVRVGRDRRPFRMFKFRSMVVGTDGLGAQSTAGDDPRITRIGAFVRRFKLDEIPQLFNIVRGEMSFVGPRPNVGSEVDLYSKDELMLLSVAPGITDFASIVFADEAVILGGSADPDRDYNLLIRPWKSRLGLHYVSARSLRLDLELMWLTAITVINRDAALRAVARTLKRTGADQTLVHIAHRSQPLSPTRPPGVMEANWEEHLTYR